MSIVSSESSKSASATARLLWLALAAPPVVLALLLVGVLSGIQPLRDRFWPLERLTPSEAAALRDPASLIDQARSGVDLNDRYAVRGRLVTPEGIMLTPLEAATTSRRPEMVGLLLDLGANPTPEQLQVILCLAERRREPEIAAILEQRRQVHSAGDCERRQLPF